MYLVKQALALRLVYSCPPNSGVRVSFSGLRQAAEALHPQAEEQLAPPLQHLQRKLLQPVEQPHFRSDCGEGCT